MQDKPHFHGDKNKKHRRQIMLRRSLTVQALVTRFRLQMTRKFSKADKPAR